MSCCCKNCQCCKNCNCCTTKTCQRSDWDSFKKDVKEMAQKAVKKVEEVASELTSPKKKTVKKDTVKTVKKTAIKKTTSKK